MMLQMTAAAQINASVLTAGDYTVYVTGLPRNVTNAELIEYASHYGEVNPKRHSNSIAASCMRQVFCVTPASCVHGNETMSMCLRAYSCLQWLLGAWLHTVSQAHTA